MEKVGRFVKDRLGLEFCLVLRTDPVSRYPEIMAKSDYCWRSLFARRIDKHKCPITRTTSGIAANVSHHITRDKISDTRQAPDHFGDRPVDKRSRGPCTDVIDTDAETVLQPVRRDIPKQWPGGWFSRAYPLTSIDELSDGVVDHFYGASDCRRDNGFG